MKMTAITTALLLATGLTGQNAFAQSEPYSGSGQQMESQPQDSSGASGSDMQSGSPYGAQPGSAGDTSGASGDMSMDSDAGAELNTAPPVALGPEEKSQDGVTYLCGGVGKEEVRYMKRQAKDYDMALTFAGRSGAYLADVNVEIKDAKGNPVLQTNCGAPMLLVNLPRSGNYRVHAETNNGYALNHTAHVNARARNPQLVALVWPQKAAETGSTAEISSGGSGSSGTGAGENGYRHEDGDCMDESGHGSNIR